MILKYILVGGNYEFKTKKQLAVGTEKNLIVTRIFTQKGQKYFHI